MTDTAAGFPATGRCNCGAIQFRLRREPMFVHCCHCTWCQRETGSAFVLNALIETAEIELLQGEPEQTCRPSNSGIGQTVLRCPQCEVALWSHFGGRDQFAFVRVGSLEEPGLCPPDIHIFTSTKQPWVELGGDTPVVPEFYRRSDYWPAPAYARYQALMPG